MLGLMTKQVFKLKDTVPTSKLDVPATREHAAFAPGHAPLEQPQDAPPQRQQPNARRRQGAKKSEAPAKARARTPAKSQVEELDRRGSRRPVSRVRHRYPGAAAFQIRHGRGPLQVDMGRR